jgi:hypothetical protein
MAEPRTETRQDNEVKRWMILLPIFVIGFMVFGLVFMNSWFGRPNYFVGMYDVSHPVSQVTYQSYRWQPVGNPLPVSDNNMIAVGYSDQGFLLYANNQEVGGGGGQRPEFGAKPNNYRQVYIRTHTGQYQLLQIEK